MANITGQGRPTRTLKANKGDIYTDANTGVKYECLGPDGFVDVEGVDEPEYYDWKEIKSASGGASDCDWEIMKNKPFGEENRTRFLCDNQSIEIVQGSDPGGTYYRGSLDSCGELVAFSDNGELEWAVNDGDTIIVVIDDVTYEATATISGGSLSFGDMSTVPFKFNCTAYSDNSYQGAYVNMTADFLGTHTFTVYWNGVEVKKIDEKFIPTTILREGIVPAIESVDTNWGVITAGATGVTFTSKVIDSQAPVLIVIGEYYDTANSQTVNKPLDWSITGDASSGWYWLAVGITNAIDYDITVKIYSNYEFNAIK